MRPSSNEEVEKLFKAAISESYSYLKQKEYDLAYGALSKATNIITTYIGLGTEAFDFGVYLGNLMVIRERQAAICFKEKNPHYDFYVIQSFEAFALNIAIDFRHFPNLSPFYYRKEIKYSIDPDELGDDMEMAFKELKIYDFRKEICDEFTNFIYYELPIVFKIPIRYDEKSVDRIFKSITSDEFDELMAFTKEFKRTHPYHIAFSINDFVTKLFRRYFDLAEHGVPEN